VGIEAFSLAGREAVVTGAGSGIGAAMARRMAEAGAAVTCADIVTDRAEQTAQEIIDAGSRARPATVDVTDRAAVDALVASVGALDVICNNAATINDLAVMDITEEELDRVLAVNLKGVLFGCQAAARVMVARRRGAIINTSSGAVDVPAPNIGCYAMSKAAVSQLTKTLASELAGAGVRVNAISPGPVDTRITARHYTEADGTVNEARRTAVLEGMRRMVPMGVMGEADDMAYAAVYLASDAARFVTGQTLHPNGGIAMPW